MLKSTKWNSYLKGKQSESNEGLAVVRAAMVVIYRFLLMFVYSVVNNRIIISSYSNYFQCLNDFTLLFCTTY
jgi:hypothetical protein